MPRLILCTAHLPSFYPITCSMLGVQWLSDRVLDSRPKGRGFEPHRRHHVVTLSKNIIPSLVLAQHRKTRPFMTERLLMGRKESNQTNKTCNIQHSSYTHVFTIRVEISINPDQMAALKSS